MILGVELLRNFVLFIILSTAIIIYQLGQTEKILLLLCSALGLYLIYLNKIKWQNLNHYFLFFIVCSISLFLNSVDVYLFFEVISGFMISLGFAANPKNKNSNMNLYFLFTIIVFSNLCYVFLQCFNTAQFDSLFGVYLNGSIIDNYHYKIGRYTSIWNEAPRFAVFLNAVTPFVIFKYFATKNKYYIIVLIAIVLMTFMTISRISIIVMILVLLYYFFRDFFKVKNILAVSIIIFFTLFFGEDIVFLLPEEYMRLFESQNDFDVSSNSLNRGVVFNMLLPIMFENPILGSGFNYKIILKQFDFSSPHNSIIELILVYGLPITIWQIIIVLNRVRNILLIFSGNILNKYRNGEIEAASISVVGIFLCSIFHGFYFDLPIFLIFWIGIILSDRK